MARKAVEPTADEQPRRPARRRAREHIVLTLRETLVFPHTTAPLSVGREQSVRALEEALRTGRQIVLLAQREPDVEEPAPGDVYDLGTLARIRQVARQPDGTQQVWVQGLERVRAQVVRHDGEPFLQASVRTLPEDDGEGDAEAEALARSALDLFQRLVMLSPFLPDELVGRAMNQRKPLYLLYLVASSLRLTVADRVELLAVDSLRDKLERVITLLEHEIELLELGEKLRAEVQDRVERGQRDFYLREQLRAIQKELGEEDPQQAEVIELGEKLAATPLPDEARQEAERELRRLERIPAVSPEHSVIRTYLDWLLALPWGTLSAAPIDVARARTILDEDHYGLEKVKDRILEHLAVKKLRQERGLAGGAHEPILCLVGPPGVGKTSLGHSIARAMDRAFTRLSLGGVHDEAEIRGHRRTYIGAMPGRVAQALRRAGTFDPVFMLDEIDKVGADWRGDPSSALLEVLDPEQNRDFRDHYLDLPLDLSNVMFVTTANTVDTIQPALRDRMEIIQLAGYTEDEKVAIARQYLVPKQAEANGLRPASEISIEDDGLRAIIRDYTHEAGVRGLEREIGGVLRKGARRIAEGSAKKVRLNAREVRAALGKPRFTAEVAERIDRPGVATGLVVTAVGGDIVFVEVSVLPGKKELRITGQLGDVMRESAEAAVSYVRGRSEELGIAPDFFERHDIHLHVPGGAVPKDGPSAGITIATALASALTRRPVRDDIAMTGEITLRGRVLPIGGVKEKCLGANRAGVSHVILPRRNENDLEDLPDELRKQLRVSLVDSVDDVLRLALRPTPAAARPSAASRGEALPVN